MRKISSRFLELLYIQVGLQEFDSAPRNLVQIACLRRRLTYLDTRRAILRLTTKHAPGSEPKRCFPVVHQGPARFA